MPNTQDNPATFRIDPTMTSNPFLESAARDALPAFDTIRPEHAAPAIDTILADNRTALAELLASLAASSPSWERLMRPLEEMDERLSRAWGPVTHLFSVLSTPEWRATFNACLPKITAYGVEVSLNEDLFHACETLAASDAARRFTPARRKVLDNALRDFRLSGVALTGESKARFKAIQLRLSELKAKFEENLLDATQAWSRHITDAAALQGMTEQGLAQAAAKARAKKLDGYLLTLDYPGFHAVMSRANNRDLRHTLYRAYATRASDIHDAGNQAGNLDNTPLMAEILALRDEQAQLLGFASYAERALQTRMAESPTQVESFLLDLASHARPHALRELEELQAHARQRDGIEELEAWDLTYYAEQLREEKFGLSDDTLRPYFPAPQVIQGLFDLTESLYGIRITPIEGISAWHADVTTYAVQNRHGAQVGLFYLDPYARENKRGGAWMDECLGRRKTTAGIQHPVAYLTCNFAPPLDGQPAQLSHDEVLTLFHEFGHGLQHLLTRVDEAAVAGIRGVPWDAVELPSQFMENWAYERDTLRRFARHWQTGEPLPDTLLDTLRAERHFGAGMATLRQVELALFDLRLHTAGPHPDIDAILRQVRGEVSILTPPDWNRFPCSFSHIFAGGYAAGYYSYKWAEVLSADAFSAFVESGFDPAIGHRFRDTVLGEGGAREARDIFRDFRGRDPAIEPLLRQDGLLDASAASATVAEGA